MKISLTKDLQTGSVDFIEMAESPPGRILPTQSGEKIPFRLLRFLLPLLLFFSTLQIGNTQNTGCRPGRFGVDGGLYSNVIEFGSGSPALNSVDWFYRFVSGGTGQGVIDTTMKSSFRTLLQGTGNPLLEARMSSGLYSFVDNQIRIDAVFGRDMFGGTGAIDQTSFETASKNGEDPAIWDPGPQNVLGKNDLIDVAGFMFRDGTDLVNSDLWFTGLINRAEPGGSAYMDFEFFVESVGYTPGGGFTTGGPDLGHTAFRFAPDGKLTKIGDLIFTLDLEGGGTLPFISSRVWVSRADFDKWLVAQNTAGNNLPFRFLNEFDGASTTAHYGYAKVVPLSSVTSLVSCGYVNVDNQLPAAPPWGTKNTKSHTYGTSYIPYSVSEMGLNMTLLGLDPVKLTGADRCAFPYITFMIKTRASAAFTAQLKDFAGPYAWGSPDVKPSVQGKDTLSCRNPSTMITANPLRADCTYEWYTQDGSIVGNPNQATITVNQPGIYRLKVKLPTGCYLPDAFDTIYYDPKLPFFGKPVLSSTVSCNGNDGTAQVVSISGANPTYTYSWKNTSGTTAGTTQRITGLAAGKYYVTIKDSSLPTSCEVVDSVTVPAKIPVVFGTPNITDVSCKGGKNGAITFTPSLVVSGKAPYSYRWSNGNTTATISNLSAGNYTVTVTDGDGCTHVSPTYNVSEPASGLTASITAKTNDTNTDPAVGNGTITLGNPSGGTSPYTYKWSGPGTTGTFVDTVQSPTGLKYGLHTVTITDNKGCTYLTGIFIYEPEICNDATDMIDNDGDGLVNCADPDCTPAAPTAITNPAVCVGQTVTYVATPPSPLPDNYTYEWTIPTGAVFVGSSTGSSVMVMWNTNAGGKVCVRGKRFSCTSTYICVDVTVKDVPAKPTDIIINNNND